MSHSRIIALYFDSIVYPSDYQPVVHGPPNDPCGFSSGSPRGPFMKTKYLPSNAYSRVSTRVSVSFLTIGVKLRKIVKIDIR